MRLGNERESESSSGRALPPRMSTLRAQGYPAAGQSARGEKDIISIDIKV